MDTKHLTIVSLVSLLVFVGCQHNDSYTIDLNNAKKVKYTRADWELSEKSLHEAASSIPSLFEEDNEYHNGLKTIESNGKIGYINTEGEMVIPPLFDNANEFYNGKYATASIEGKYGVIDTKGNFIIQPKYEIISELSNRLFWVHNGDDTWIIDINGKNVVVPGYYEQIELYSINGYIKVLKNNLYGVIDLSGKEIIAPQYDDIGEIWDTNGFIEVKKNGKYGLIDIHNHIVVPIEHKATHGTSQDRPATVFPFDGIFSDDIGWFEIYNDRSVIARTIDRSEFRL